MVDFHLLLLGTEEKPHPSLPLCNFCQLTTTLGNIKLKLEKLRDSKKVRKKPHLPTACKFPVGKLGYFFFLWKAVKKGIFPITYFLSREMLELQPVLF